MKETGIWKKQESEWREPDIQVKFCFVLFYIAAQGRQYGATEAYPYLVTFRSV